MPSSNIEKTSGTDDAPLYVYNDDGKKLDISKQPVMDAPSLPELVSSSELNRKAKAYGRYEYNGMLVPRVTAILNYCEGDPNGLALYASRIGYKYAKEQKRTLDIGTNVHAAIAEYLTKGSINCIRNINEDEEDEVYESVSNFIAWYSHVVRDLGWTVEAYLSEQPIICPWCGGTLDAVLIINGRKYIVDFKSSKKLSTNYFIQVSAYLWMIENFYPEYLPIHGVGLIRIDKFKDSYEDVFLDLSDPNDAMFISHCQQTFGLALKIFYSMNILDQEVIDVKDEERQEVTKSNMSSSIEEELPKKKPRRKK